MLTADSSVTALNVLDCNPQVDLVISEAVLPGGSGSELIGIVKQLFPSAAVMFTTAYTEESLDPAIFCLQKPFTIGTLMNRVEKFCREADKVRPSKPTLLLAEDDPTLCSAGWRIAAGSHCRPTKANRSHPLAPTPQQKSGAEVAEFSSRLSMLC